MHGPGTVVQAKDVVRCVTVTVSQRRVGVRGSTNNYSQVACSQPVGRSVFPSTPLASRHSARQSDMQREPDHRPTLELQCRSTSTEYSVRCSTRCSDTSRSAAERERDPCRAHSTVACRSCSRLYKYTTCIFIRDSYTYSQYAAVTSYDIACERTADTAEL